MSAFVAALADGNVHGTDSDRDHLFALGKAVGCAHQPFGDVHFLPLGKIKFWDALFYIAAQFIGAVLGVLLVGAVLWQADF